MTQRHGSYLKIIIIIFAAIGVLNVGLFMYTVVTEVWEGDRPDLQLYTGVVIAERSTMPDSEWSNITETTHREVLARHAISPSEESAADYLIRTALRELPPHEGWSEHTVLYCKPPQEKVPKILALYH